VPRGQCEKKILHNLNYVGLPNNKGTSLVIKLVIDERLFYYLLTIVRASLKWIKLLPNNIQHEVYLKDLK
jgi:hypothetical protein